jgi:hypothetical protein
MEETVEDAAPSREKREKRRGANPEKCCRVSPCTTDTDRLIMHSRDENTFPTH